MASHPDALFDNNKYYFPEGIAKVREQAQPWLEVPAERDEQGTPGLQPLPDEQKTVSQHVQGLYGNYSAPFLPVAPGQDSYGAASSSRVMPVTHVEQQNQWSHTVVAQAEQQWPYMPPAATGQYQDWTQQAAADLDELPAPSARIQPGEYLEPSLPLGHSNLSTGTPRASGHHSYSSFEVASQYSDGYSSQGALTYEQRTHDSATLVTGTWGFSNKEAGKSAGKVISSWRAAGRRRLWWFIAGVIFGLLVVVGAVVGGILGAKAAAAITESSSTDGVSSSGESNTTSTASSIRTNSRMAVSGYRGINGNYTLRLFFQDLDNHIRFMDKTSVDSKWTDPVTLSDLEYEPMANGSIAAGSYLGTNPVRRLTLAKLL